MKVSRLIELLSQLNEDLEVTIQNPVAMQDEPPGDEYLEIDTVGFDKVSNSVLLTPNLDTGDEDPDEA